MSTWALGVSTMPRSAIGSYGLLASADGWLIVGFVSILTGFVLELVRRRPRSWLLALHVIALVVAIHATVPILFGTPEYAWVYKHIGVTQQLGLHGRVTDSSDIYQLWPALFAASAALGKLGHVSPLTFAVWAPLAFELAGALLVIAIFRLLTRSTRVTYLAALLYVGLISWVGQDYFSPQAFGYLLWLGIVLIILRWLRPPVAQATPSGTLGRLRAPLLAGLEPSPTATRAMRAVAVVLIAVAYFAIVAAHQLTPYIALASVGSLTILGQVRPRWLMVLMATIAIAYLIPRYGLIAHDFGGLFSGSNPVTNASGVRGASHAGAEQATATIVRGLAACMWLLALTSIVLRRRMLGVVAIPAALAFTPFVLLVFQRYGGEAIYRTYLFSAPWCSLLIARMLSELRRPVLRGTLICAAGGVALFAGLQGLYGPVLHDAFTPSELSASRWLFSRAPRGALIVLADEDFPSLETASSDAYHVHVVPADPQLGDVTVDEGSMGSVERWVAGLGQENAYVVTSRSMGAYAGFFGAPRGYEQFVRAIPGTRGWSLRYRNADTAIYLLNLEAAAGTIAATPAPAAAAPATTAPTAAAAVPARIARARDGARSRRARTAARGRVRTR